MNSKYVAAGIFALIIGYLSTSEAARGPLAVLVLSVGPLVVVGLLVAGYYETKNK